MQQEKRQMDFNQENVPLKPTFKVLTAYQNHSALSQASATVEQVQILCDADADISCKFWNFALFRSEELTKYAAREAAAAEMIIISLDGSGELPTHVKRWVESWPIRLEASRAALVVLMGRRQDHGGERAELLAYLQRVSDICGLDFLCDQDDWEASDFPRRLAAAWDPVRAAECITSSIFDLAGAAA
jgi:hypothetical protein